MSNNAHVNDDEIEIHQLPEVSTLQAGMMVAVDSQPTGTKSFNLTTALEGKVDVPATTPAEGQVLTIDSNGTPIWSYGTPPVTLYHHWEKVNGDYNDNTEYLDFDVSSSGIKSAIVVIHMAMNAGKYVLFNVEGINMSDSTFGGTDNYAHNNSDFNGIKPSVTNIMDYQYIGIKAIRIKHHGSQQHKFSTETYGIDIKVIGFK